MNDREYQFLKEYCSIVLPFTIALDILQGEDICFYGTLLTNARSSKFQNSGNYIWPTSGLPESIVEAIKSRFAKTLDSKDALLAAVSLPEFQRPEDQRPEETTLSSCSLRNATPLQMPNPQTAAAAPIENFFFL